MQEINGHNQMRFRAELHKIAGGNERQSTQQQNIIDDLMTQMSQVPPPYTFSGKRPKPLSPVPADSLLIQHPQSIEMSQTSKQKPASSSNNPESAHEAKEPIGRPRKDHGVPTKTRTYSLWWSAQPVGMITTQLSNMGWREPHFQHFTPTRDTEQTINKKTLFKTFVLYTRRT